jgi:hypothetical protein
MMRRFGAVPGMPGRRAGKKGKKGKGGGRVTARGTRPTGVAPSSPALPPGVDLSQFPGLN